ncbi:MAG: PQQ-binding-like beta-propeller repeat protein [Vicinamibacterales bacterium]
MRRLGGREKTGALAVVLALAAPGWVSVSTAQDWPSWRGPANDGMARGDAPVTWDENTDVKWKVDLPGRGQSSPVVWGNQIFVTTAIQIGPQPARSGGRRRSPHGDTGPQAAHRFVILSIDRTTGEVLWERTATEATPQEGFHPQYGSFASNSPVTDGEHVFAYFGSRGLYCYDLDGQLIWQKDLGPMRRFLQFGEGTPLVLHDDRLIVKADHEGDSFIVALDKATGAELWRTARDEVTSWSPPLVVEHDGLRQVIVAATGKVRSYDYDTGAVIWEVRGLGRNQIPAPVHQDDLVFVMSGFIAPNLMAIRLGGQGDLTGSDAIVWTNTRANAYTPSPVLFDGQLYVLTDSGVLTNFDATTGHMHYRQRLPGPSNFKASPIGVNGKLYLASEEGRVFVVTMGPEFALLATNTLEDQTFIATPAIVDGEVFLRSQAALYCINPSR